jgi:hypothetical protein
MRNKREDRRVSKVVSFTDRLLLLTRQIARMGSTPADVLRGAAVSCV